LTNQANTHIRIKPDVEANMILF